MGIITALCNTHQHQRERIFHFRGILGLLPALALGLAFFYSMVCPLTSRLLLKRAYLTEQYEGTPESMRLAQTALAWDPLYREAREYLMKRMTARDMIPEAFRMISKASDMEPENGLLHLDRGRLLAMQGEEVSAAEAYQKAVDVDHGSNNLPLYYARLIAQQAQCGWKEKAVENLKTALQRGVAIIHHIPWAVQSHATGRDDLYLALKDTDEILRLEDVLVEVQEEYEASLHRGESQDRFHWFTLFQAFSYAQIFDRALQVLDHIEQIFGENEKATVQYHRAEIAKWEGNLNDAAALAERAERIGDETNPGAALLYRTQQTEMLLEKGKRSEAVSIQWAILSKLRDYRNYQYIFINALDPLLEGLRKGSDPAARIKPLAMRLFFTPKVLERIPLLLERATCLHAAGRYEEAEEEVVEILARMAAKIKGIYPYENDPEVQRCLQRSAYLLMEVYEAMGFSPEQGLRRAWHATDLFSPKAARLLFRYYFLLRSRMPEGALRVLQIARLDEDKSLLLLEGMVDCYHMLDDMNGVRETYKTLVRTYKAKGIDPEARLSGLFKAAYDDRENIEIILDLARLFSCLHRFEQGQNVLREALKIHPESSEILRLMALNHRLTDDPETSRSTLERALHKDPKNFKAASALMNLKSHLGREIEKKEGGGHGL
jgi:tetratricopeptide (TPR) repeat protein